MVAERLSSLDLSFLCLEGTNTPMHLGAVLVFGKPDDVADVDVAERLAALLRHRAAAVPRLRRRLAPVAFPPGAAAWVDDPAFDPADYVHTSTRDPQQQADGRDRHSTADTDRDGIDIQDRQRLATASSSARLSQLLWDRGVCVIASC